jgi:hypothetical protein
LVIGSAYALRRRQSRKGESRRRLHPRRQLATARARVVESVPTLNAEEFDCALVACLLARRRLLADGAVAGRFERGSIAGNLDRIGGAEACDVLDSACLRA